MSPNSPSSSTLPEVLGEKEEGAEEIPSQELQLAGDVVQAPRADVDMEDVSELALGMDDWASKQLELLARQLQEEAEREQRVHEAGPDPESTGAHEPMDLTLNEDNHDLTSLVQAATSDLYNNTATEDLMAAIISHAEQGDGSNDKVPESGVDETENMINSFFSSDFLDQLNESSSEQIDLDILGAVGQMQFDGSGMVDGDGRDLGGLDDFDEEDQAALLRDLVALSRQPSISPTAEEPDFRLPHIPADGLNKFIQIEPGTKVEDDGESHSGSQQPNRLPLESTKIPEEEAPTLTVDKTASQPNLDAVSVDNMLAAPLSTAPESRETPAALMVKPPSDPVTPIPDNLAPALESKEADANHRSVIPTAVETDEGSLKATTIAPTIVDVRPGATDPASVPGPDRPDLQTTTTNPLPGNGGFRPPLTSPSVTPTPRPAIANPLPRPMSSVPRPPGDRPSPFVSNRPQALSTTSVAPPPILATRPASRPGPRPATMPPRPALVQRPASGPMPRAPGRPGLAGPPGVRPVSSGSIPSSTSKRPPGLSPRPAFIGPARLLPTLARPPRPDSQPRPSTSTASPRPSVPLARPRPPSIGAMPSSSTLRPPAPAAPRPHYAGIPVIPSRPIPLDLQEPEESHQHKRRRLEPETGSDEDVNATGLGEFADILSIPIPGMSQINGDLLESSGGEKLSQAQIDEIVASLGRPATMGDRTEESEASEPGLPTLRANAVAGPSRITPEVETDPIHRAAIDEEIDELDDEDDPAAQAQELLAMISALLPPGEDDNKDDGGQSEDELDPDNYKMEDSPAPSITDDRPRKENETPAEKKEKKRRNRMVLSCTECHRRKQQCDRNIPCARCVKRGVPELCHMDAPLMPPRKHKRKRDDGAFLQAMSEPGFDWNARVRALEDLLRTNPAAFADLDLNGSLVDGVSSLQTTLSEMPSADEQEMQNQVQAVISLINQAQAAQHQLELDAQHSLPEMVHLTPTGPMLPSASSLQSPTVPTQTKPGKSSAPKPLTLNIKVEENISAPNSPLHFDQHPTAAPPPPSARSAETPQSDSRPTVAPIPTGPGTVPPLSETQDSAEAPLGDGVKSPPGSAAIRKVIRQDSPPATPALSPAQPTPNVPEADAPASTTLSMSTEAFLPEPELTAKESDNAMQIDTPPAVALRDPLGNADSPIEAPSIPATNPPLPEPSGGSSIQPMEVETPPDKSLQTAEAGRMDQLEENPSFEQTLQPQSGSQSEEVPIEVQPVSEADSTAMPISVGNGDQDDLVSPKQESDNAPPPHSQAKIDNLRDTGTLNIPANLQAELAKLAKGVQDSAFADDLNDNGLESNRSNILGDPSALLAQLAHSMGPPTTLPPASAQDESQNAILMDMISQLANGGNAAQNTSLLNNLLAPISTAASSTELWSQVPQAALETNQQVAMSFMTDLGHNKLNLGLSGFRQDDGSIFVPPTTRSVERSMHMRGGLSHDALPIEGHAPFLDLGVKFAYGKDGHVYKDGRIAAVQAMSLTGALRIGATFLSRFPAQPTPKMIFIPNPTVEEEAFAIRDSGLEIQLYRFFDRRTGGVDWEGMREDLQNAPGQSIVLLHVGGSTPTGAELSTAQWRLITEVIKQQRHIPFFIMEYQGLSSGNVDRDAQPLRTMAHKKIPLVLAQTFDAAMGLYSDSPAILSVVTNATADKPRIESQLKAISRTMHAHPPPWGAHVAANILGNETAFSNWSQEVKAMADRLKSIRDKLFDQLTNRLKTPGNWSHIRKTQGMYCTTLLTTEQLQVLGYREHIHLLPDGCFSLGCLNAAKIEQLARAIDNVIRQPPPVEDDDLAAQAALQIEMALRQGFGSDAGF